MAAKDCPALLEEDSLTEDLIPDTDDIMELKATVMAHARRSADLEALLAGMKQAEQEYITHIQELKQAVKSNAASKAGNSPTEDASVQELETMAVKYAERNAELEQLVENLKQEDRLLRQQLADVQQAPPAADQERLRELEELAGAYDQRNGELESLLEEMKEAEKSHLVQISQLEQTVANQEAPDAERVAELEDLVANYDQRNGQLEALVREMKEVEQEQSVQMQELRQAQRAAPSPERLAEIEELAAERGRQGAQLEAIVRDLKQAEQRNLARIAQLEADATEGEVNAKAVTELEQVASAQAHRADQLEAMLEDMREAEREHLQQIAALRQQQQQEEQIQAQRLSEAEEAAERCARRCADVEASNSELKQADKGHVAQIARLQQQLAEQSATRSEGLDELEEVAAQHLRRSEELEVQLRTAERAEKVQAARLAELEGRVQLTAELEDRLEELTQLEQGHVAQIAQLQQMTAMQDDTHSKRLMELEDLARRSAELEAVVKEQKQAKKGHMLQISQLQQSVSAHDGAQSRKVAEMQEAMNVIKRRNAELEATVEDLKITDQGNAAHMQQLQQMLVEVEANAAPPEKVAELKAVINDHVQQIHELEDLVAGMQEAERQRVQEVQRARGAQERSQQLEVVVADMQKAEHDLRRQLAEGEGKTAKVNSKASARIKELENALDAQMKKSAELKDSVEGMKRKDSTHESQVQKLKSAIKASEQSAAVAERRNGDLEVELGGMKKLQDQHRLQISQLEKMAAGTDSLHVARIVELEAAVSAHLQRNTELEAALESMQTRQAALESLMNRPVPSSQAEEPESPRGRAEGLHTPICRARSEREPSAHKLDEAEDDARCRLFSAISYPGPVATTYGGPPSRCVTGVPRAGSVVDERPAAARGGSVVGPANLAGSILGTSFLGGSIAGASFLGGSIAGLGGSIAGPSMRGKTGSVAFNSGSIGGAFCHSYQPMMSAVAVPCGPGAPSGTGREGAEPTARLENRQKSAGRMVRSVSPVKVCQPVPLAPRQCCLSPIATVRVQAAACAPSPPPGHHHHAGQSPQAVGLQRASSMAQRQQAALAPGVRRCSPPARVAQQFVPRSPQSPSLCQRPTPRLATRPMNMQRTTSPDKRRVPPEPASFREDVHCMRFPAVAAGPDLAAEAQGAS